jgi:hypothetical protein
LKGEEIAYIPLVILTRKALEINHRDFTNRVIITFTPVGNELGSPWMHPPEEPPSRAEAGYWSPMLEKAGVQIRGVRPLL